MMLTEQTTVLLAALPVQEMKDHLRLGTGFSEDGLQDGLVAAHLRAALAAIESRTGKALLARRFLLRLPEWRERGGAQTLPLAPVSEIVSVTVVDAAGARSSVAPDRYRLEADLARPRLTRKGQGLPAVPDGGSVEIVFEAGFGPAWADIPMDLAQAVLLLAAEFYEFRHDGGQRASALPLAVQSLIERWRTVRLLGGGCA